jgi:protein-tyrosine kinase
MSPELQRIRQLIAGIEAKERESDQGADRDRDSDFEPPAASRLDRAARDQRRTNRARERTADPDYRREREGLAGSLLAPVVDLDPRHLQSQRIIAYDGGDPRVRPFDLLRAQVLQAMAQKGWTIVGVTSPTAECGKSVIAANLAFSAARQPDLDVLLVDFDLRRPQLAHYLGAPVYRGGLLGLLKDRGDIEGNLTPTRAGSRPLLVLPTAPAADPTEFTDFDAARHALRAMRNALPDGIVIVDLPPVLTSDDGVTILPHVDCVLLVTAAGVSKTADVEQCAAQLREANVVRVVVNKAG